MARNESNTRAGGGHVPEWVANIENCIIQNINDDAGISDSLLPGTPPIFYSVFRRWLKSLKVSICGAFFGCEGVA